MSNLYLYLYFLSADYFASSVYKPAKCIIPRASGARHNWDCPPICSARPLNPLQKVQQVQQFHPYSFILIHTAHEAIFIPRAQRREGVVVSDIVDFLLQPPLPLVHYPFAYSSITRRLLSDPDVYAPSCAQSCLRLIIFFHSYCSGFCNDRPAAGGRLADSPLDGIRSSCLLWDSGEIRLWRKEG